MLKQHPIILFLFAIATVTILYAGNQFMQSNPILSFVLDVPAAIFFNSNTVYSILQACRKQRRVPWEDKEFRKDCWFVLLMIFLFWAVRAVSFLFFHR